MTRSENRKAWIMVALVFMFMVINFADKAVIGLSSVPIMRELGLSHAEFGLLGSSFFILFSASGVVVGFLSNRFSTKLIMLVMALVWALAVLPLTGSATFTFLLATRVILGAAEGPAFPVALHAVYKWFNDGRRALPTSIVACGAAVGTGAVAPLVTWIIVHYSWHSAFGVLGMVGLIWSAVWFAIAKDGPVDEIPKRSNGLLHRIPYTSLLLSRTALGVYAGGFAAYWVIALNIVWLANYLIKALHLPPPRPHG